MYMYSINYLLVLYKEALDKISMESDLMNRTV